MNDDNFLSPLSNDSRLEMPDISRLKTAGILPFGGLRMGTNIPIPAATMQSVNPVKRPAPVSPTAETVKIVKKPAAAPKADPDAPKLGSQRPVPFPVSAATHNTLSAPKLSPAETFEANSFVRKPAAPTAAQTAPTVRLTNPSKKAAGAMTKVALPALPSAPSPAGTSLPSKVALLGTAAVIGAGTFGAKKLWNGATRTPGVPGTLGAHPATQVARGLGYGSTMGAGAGLGALGGFLAPGEEKDENGNTVHKSRLGGALHGAVTGAGVGAAANFAKNRILNNGGMTALNKIPHSATPAAPAAATPHAVDSHADAPLVTPKSVSGDVEQAVAAAPYQPRRANASGPAAPAGSPTVGRDAGDGVNTLAAVSKLPPIFKPASAKQDDVPNAEKATDPELNVHADTKLPYKVPTLKLKKK